MSREYDEQLDAESWIVAGITPPVSKWDGASPLTLDQYQGEARKTAIFSPAFGIAYTALGLAGEAGEVAGKIKKWLRDDKPDSINDAPSFERTEQIAQELGDVLWYAAVLADQLGLKLSNVARMNITKIRERQARGTLGGDGDKR